MSGRAVITIEVDVEHLQGVLASVNVGLHGYYRITKTQPFGPVRVGTCEVHKRIMAAFQEEVES